MKDEATWPERRRVRISVIVPSLNRGGTETQLLAVLPRLRERGFDINIVTLAAPGVLADAFRARGIGVEGLLGSRPALPRLLIGLLGLPVLICRLRARRPDIVHTFLPLAGIAGGLAARLAGCPRLVTSRRNRNHYQRRHRLAGLLERLINRRAQAVTANSRKVAADLAGEGVPRGRIALIYNGVQRDQRAPDRASARKELGLGPDCLVMVVVANLVAYKGHADLLEALAIAAPRIEGDWRLLLVGRDDGMGALLRARAAEGALAGRVVFAGEHGDVRRFLAASDISVLPSHEEGFSNSVLEGMEAGLAMLVTDVGGNAEAVEDGRSGLVVPAQAPQLLAEAILRLAGDEALRERLGEAARQRAHGLFDLDRAAEQLAALYASLIEAGSVPAHLAPAHGELFAAEEERRECAE